MQLLVCLMSVVAAIRFDTEDEVARIIPIHAGCARISQAHLLSAGLAFTRDSAHAAISLRIRADERVDNFTGASLILLVFAFRSD
jgi:hypothetical protein